MSAKQSDVIILNDQPIKPGQNAHVRMNVAGLPTGTQIHINTHVYRAKKPGPSVLLLGGMHGDEVNGVEIVRRIVASKVLKSLQRGTVIAIPILNVYGFINFSRSVRDGKDVNRSFPGSKSGSLASQVAHMMSDKILPLIDFGVDFHTGGSTISNFPQLRVSHNDEDALDLARIFSPPIILKNKPIPKSHRLHAYKMGKPILVFEGGESLRMDEDSIRTGIQGVHRLLNHHGMLSMPIAEAESHIYERSKWIRAPRAGIVNIELEAGVALSKGDLLATIHDLDTLKKVSVKSPMDGFLIAHVNNPVVSRGDALFHIVY